MSKVSRRGFLRAGCLAGVAVPLSGVLDACGSSATPSSSKAAAGNPKVTSGQTVLIAPPVALNAAAYWNAWTKGATTAAEALGMVTHVENFNGDTATQLAAFQNMPSLGIKCVVTEANTPAVATPLFQYCQREGIYGVNSWSAQPWTTPPSIGDKYVSYIEFANDLAFEAVCSFLFKKMGGSGKVIHISGTPGTLPSEYRDLGLKNALRKFPRIQLLATEYGNYSASQTATVVQNMLTSYPVVDAIICQNDDSAMGALSVIKNQSHKPLVIGCDGTSGFLDAIVAGNGLATVANNAPWLGGAQVVEVFDAMNGFRLKPLERMQRFEAFVINTPAAASAYKKLMWSGKFPYDYAKMSRVVHPNDWDMQTGVTVASPDVLWSQFAPNAAARSQLPAVYQQATQSSYDQLDAVYKAHLTSDPFDAVKRLCKPVDVID
jgi:ribose transport system substrate-binding protein